ncbi:MAG TPA: hypothetical protein VFY10_07280, partial [Dehalococcoidia bacterium]|nr:hypothetical protein [Dehalococcoidia bacterium]
FGRKSYDELREKLVSMGFLQEGEMGDGTLGGSRPDGGGPSRTVGSMTPDNEEELGPVAKALLEALKESGREGLGLESEDEDEDGDEGEEEA